jgi:hypothetical protein
MSQFGSADLAQPPQQLRADRLAARRPRQEAAALGIWQQQHLALDRLIGRFQRRAGGRRRTNQILVDILVEIREDLPGPEIDAEPGQVAERE